MATHSSIPAGKIPWTEEPGGLQFMGLQRVGRDLSMSKVEYWGNCSFLGPTLKTEFELMRGKSRIICHRIRLEPSSVSRN